MSAADNVVRGAFQRPVSVLVKIDNHGFRIDDDLTTAIEGRVVKTMLLRKRFDGSVLISDSQGGVTARNGTACESCLQPLCRQQLRIYVHDGVVSHVIDLAATSVRNFFRIEDEIRRRALMVSDVVLRLTVVDRYRWGEVCFQIR